MHNRRCSAAQATVHNRVITKPCKGEIIKLASLFGVHNAALAGCRDAMHCVSTILSYCASLHRRLCTSHPCGIRKENDKNKNYTE
ncbi:MAG: hypothetical protein LBT09_05685 [Planctomycetaceae bacterium]|jgi:hypothetical protein|nr:hypothetical protein [Planctomycetaceae bacterium]